MLSNIYSFIKIFYDRTTDYLTYSKTNDIIIPDKLEDYKKYLDISKYENENNTIRVFPQETYLTAFKSFINPATHIIDNIYLGSAYNASSYDELKKDNIKLIINVTNEISNYYPNDFTYINIPIYDNNKKSIHTYFNNIYKQIRDYQLTHPTDNILIHCFMGASRSCSIVAFYIMQSKFYTVDNTIDFIKNKRPIVNPTFRILKDLVIANNIILPDVL